MYKFYTRLPSIYLKTFNYTGEYKNLLRSRRSNRGFSKKPITIDALSEILYFSVGIASSIESDREPPKRHYPSAGAKYPLEIYPLVFNATGFSPGLYHYNVIDHSLEVLLANLNYNDIEKIWMSQEWFRKASVILIVTMIPDRITTKYGKRGLQYGLIESGYLGQNVYLICEKLKIGCSAVGEFNEKSINELLDIRPYEEIPIHYLALGN